MESKNLLNKCIVLYLAILSFNGKLLHWRWPVSIFKRETILKPRLKNGGLQMKIYVSLPSLKAAGLVQVYSIIWMYSSYSVPGVASDTTLLDSCYHRAVVMND